MGSSAKQCAGCAGLSLRHGGFDPRNLAALVPDFDGVDVMQGSGARDRVGVIVAFGVLTARSSAVMK